MAETFPQLLNRLATTHLNNKTTQYIKQLEMIAEAAKYAANQDSDFVGKDALLETLKNLPEVA
ncbi:hypothetical protein [Anabaena azotica]|uniref:Uncharacterized protein n=1 Tax=Anabaena azotica FACHB-119 TaxID=947527 RepID=A0ABR8D0J4_9NOST|nr:hypothetical protein [Anabaena azotica]MBD2499837.1 hypothetical protein [Anabaena azotica FACHB-119]